MKQFPVIIVTSSVVILAMIGCGLGPTPTPGLSDAEVAATVNAAVAATGAAETNMQATIDAAVAATGVAAGQPAAQPTATATLVVAPTDTPLPEQAAPAPTEAPSTPTIDASTMTEEELAAAIEEAVLAAMVATNQAAAATNEAANDGTVSYEETVTVEVSLANADEALALAEALIVAYYDIYGVYASEAFYALSAIENELVAIEDDIETITQIVIQGGEAASAAIEQIQAAAVAAITNQAQVGVQIQGWHDALQAEIETRAANALATQPDQVASDRVGAIQSAFQYLEVVQTGLADGAISPEELSGIAQAGANASASIRAHGGPGLESVADSIDGVTTQVARGDLPQAKGSLSALESSLPRRP